MKKKVVCFLKYLCIFILILLLSIIVYLFCMRNIFKSYVNEEKIRGEISNIDVMSLLKENGEEIEEVKKLKSQLVEVGIPSESIDYVLNSSVIKDTTASLVSEGVNYIFTGEEISIVNNFNSGEIIKFTSDNLSIVALELKKNNVPGSDKLTEERQEKIIKNMEEYAPKVEDTISKVSDKVRSKIEESPNYKKINNYKDKIDRFLSIVRFIYSDSMTYLFVGSILIISILIILFFRNNGIYVLVLSIPFLALVLKKYIKKIAVIFIIILSFNFSYNKIVLPYFKIPAGSIREMLSIPFQQTARYVSKYSVSSDEKEAIDKILVFDDLASRDRSDLSDPVKEKFNKYYTKADLIKYFKVWFIEGIKHPDTYIEATLLNTYGYLYPNTSNWYIYYKYDKKLSDAGFDYH